MKIVNLNELPDLPLSHDPNIKKKVMISNGQIPKLTNFSQAVFKPGQSAEAHFHKDMYEVFLVTGGGAQFTVNGQVHQLGTGSCILVELNETHEVLNNTDNDLVITYFGIAV